MGFCSLSDHAYSLNTLVLYLGKLEQFMGSQMFLAIDSLLLLLLLLLLRLLLLLGC